MVTMSDGNELVSLVEKLAREAQHAAKTCGRRDFDKLEAVAQQFMTLYQALKARGVVE
jgi:hypothetical protein